MNSKRKADLQRRLSMASIPKPPAGLAERIKREIPQPLASGSSRPGSMLTMRIAASVLLVIGLAWLSTSLMSRWETENQTAPVMVRRTPEPQPAFPEPGPEAVSTSPSSGIPMPVPPAAALERSAAPQIAETTRAMQPMPAADAPTTQGAAADSASPAPAPAAIAAGGSAPAAVNARETAAAAPAIAAAPAPRVEAEKSAVSADLARPAAAAQKIAVPRSVEPAAFGVPVGEEAFQRVKSAIEHGEHPRSVDVPALVNYFAGRQEPQKDAVSLDAEVSPEITDRGANVALLRVSVDSRRGDAGDASPVARDLRLEIDPDPLAVAGVHGSNADGSQPVVLDEPRLAPNVSTTLIYRLEMRLPLRTARVATVRLSFDDPSGSRRTITTTVNGRALLRSWTAASRRQRLATLGEAWGSVLRVQSASGEAGASPRKEEEDVARRAAELATQEPSDARAQALANLASAFYRLRSSGPTGSGR